MDKNILWAKKARGLDGTSKWLPLSQHLLDTKFVISMLYEHYLSEHQRKIIQKAVVNQLDSSAAKQVVAFTGLVHDIGKATPAFQTKPSYQGLGDLDEMLMERLFSKGFVPDDYLSLLSRSNRSPHAMAGENILEHFGVRNDIGSIVGGHHGKPLEYDSDCDNIDTFSDNYYYEMNSNNPIHIKWFNLQKELFEWALSENGYDDVRQIPKINDVSAQVIIEGLLVMADWIASNEKYFPLFEENQTECDNLQQRMENGWLSWFKNTRWEPKFNADADQYYQENFGFTPRGFQRKIFNTIKNTPNPGIMIVEAGMGMGKTEVALSAVEQLAQKQNCDGMFYCLPTQATTNAMFNRILTWLSKVSAMDDESKDIQLVHGKSALNRNYANLPKNIDIGEDRAAGVMVNQWFSGNKTAILDDFVVGTVDQLLLLALKKKHLALRHLGFSSKVVVIDEAHGFDSYMQTYLCRALQWLGKYHIPVVILSATLPAQKRMDFINSYLDKSSVDDKVYNNLSYPLVSYSDGNDVKVLDDFEPIKQTTDVMIKRMSGDNSDLINKVKEMLSDGGICGIIVNTVKRAQTIGQMFIDYFGTEKVDILHASFLDTDRSVKERSLLKEIGKKDAITKRPKLKIVIGTQVLEQSLDIDFDILFTDLAPMDLMLQRMGRLHRHAKNNANRPIKLKNPQLYVLSINDNYEYEEGASFIYGDLLLMRTQYFLPNQINLPNDISKLVQQVYDFSIPIKLNDDLNSKYKSAYEDYHIKIQSKKISASTYILDNYDDVHANLIGWLNNDDKQQDDSDAKGLAQVRDGDDTIEVIMVKANDDGGYSILGEKDDISNDVAMGDLEATIKLAKNTIKLPQMFSKNYNIEKTIDFLEKFNKQYLSNWQFQPYLKGSLGIILDENNQFTLSNHVLTYDKNIGLTVE
ncbi:CRISPR-associated helicase Cas3' [Apilactobacillus xinyiensis]|uniref:CRISPR-associated helicase Cas3' n=1 Tax=Apilactobacillus xinyiensis TaxID=2841032 RepID=UPI001C7D7240|nr:CRISPR-associated helicase Cas3' [Apilactobacillus xinyiensis]